MNAVRPDLRRILVVKLASLGDVLTMTPTLRALRSSFPRAYIAVLVTPGTAVALGGLDSVDEVIPFDKFAFDRPRDALRGLPRAGAFGARLRAGRWDALLLLHHLTTSFGVAKYAALALSSGAPIRAGLDNGRGRWFLTHPAEDRGFAWRHEVDYNLSVAQTLGASYPGSPHLELAIAPADEAWAAAQWQSIGSDGDKRFLVGPGSGAFSTARRWAPERFAQVASTVRERYGLQPVILGGVGADEQAIAAGIASQVGATVLPAAPRPQALAAFIRRCRLLIANDGGPVHLAAAVQTPVVAIFGPTNDGAWGPYPPYEPRNQVVRETLACAPCVHRGHAFGTPQGCPARTCLAILTPERVLGGVAAALAAPRLAEARHLEPVA